MPPKRKDILSDHETNDETDTTVCVAKKHKPNRDIPKHVPIAELGNFSRDELIERVIALEKMLSTTDAALEKSRASLNNAGKNSALAVTGKENVAPVAWSAEKVAEKAEILGDMCAKSIKKQMKWQRSCKTSSSRWSYTGIAPTPEVFFEMLGLPSDGKAWKMKKIPIEDFQNELGYISASARFSNLSITGKTVSVRWVPDENQFTISGTYGIGF